MSNNYNHKKNESELLQKITNIAAFVLELYSKGLISEDIKTKLLEVISKWKNMIKLYLYYIK